MFKTLLASALFATAASQAVAEPHGAQDLSILPADVAARVVQLQGFGDRFEGAIDAIFAEWSRPGHAGAAHELDLTLLPPEVAVQVMALQRHGERFDGAIRAIFIEALNPGWGPDGDGPVSPAPVAAPPHG